MSGKLSDSPDSKVLLRQNPDIKLEDRSPNGDSVVEERVAFIDEGGKKSTFFNDLNCFSQSKKGHYQTDNTSGIPEPKVYLRRYVILILFCLCSMTNAYQWIHLNIIFDVIKTYYNESLPYSEELQNLSIDGLSMVYMVAYIPLIFPATYLLDRKGVRICAILGTLLNCLGAWLKCVAVNPSRFAVLFVAQSLCAIAQIFTLFLPARIAAVWFGPTQVSTATAVGVFGNQLGVALGFVIPPYVVKVHEEDLSETGRELSYMFYAGAGYMTFLFILVIFVFSNSPPRPPSMAQYKAVMSLKEEHYFKSLLRLLKNRPFMLLVFTYGMNVGVFYAISTLLNPVILGYFDDVTFPNIHTHLGWIGLSIVIAGLLGSVVAGIWLDKTKLFKITTIIIYGLSLAGMIAFTFTLLVKKIWVVYVTSISLGFFMTGYLPVGFEFAAELTYPESEGTSSGLLNASAQIFGIALTIAMGQILRIPGDSQSNIRNSLIVGCVILLLGGLLTIAIKNNLLRHKAELGHQKEEQYEKEAGLDDEKEDFSKDS